MQVKLASVGLIITFAAAAVAAWATSPACTGQAQAISGAIAPHELQLQIDTKSLPAQETGDLI